MIGFTDGAALIVVVPSRTHNGVYLVRVEQRGLKLIVSHDCLTARSGTMCRHVLEAKAAYERTHWWEPKKEVVLDLRRIVLRPEWKQVNIPASPEEVIRAVICDAS